MNLIDKMQLEASYRINQRIEDITDEQETKAPEKNLKELTEAIFNLVSAVAMTIPDENQVFEVKAKPEKKTKIDEVRAWVDIPGKETKARL